jgi:hypothetical protein
MFHLYFFFYIPTLDRLISQENNPIHNSFKEIKHLGLNLTKKVKGLYNEIYKILKKETEATRRWNDIPC